MKRLSLALMFLALPSLADGTLWPAEHTTCLNANNPEFTAPACPANTTLYVDGDNRCGCLGEDQFYTADVCESSKFACDESLGQTFSTLYSAGEMCGRTEVGCGCFSTEGGVHITSVDGPQ